jgi:hypothetical protein
MNTSVAAQITVTFMPPLYNEDHSPNTPSLAVPTGFRLYLGQTAGEQHEGGSYSTSVDLASNVYTYTFMGLTPGQIYRVSGATLNAAGVGNASPERFATCS